MKPSDCKNDDGANDEVDDRGDGGDDDDDDDDDDKDDDDDVMIKLQSNLAITDVMEH